MTTPETTPEPHPQAGDAAEDVLLTIGQVARSSGLPASALRFYDREGVLVPADVDPATGYRRYAPSQLRAAGLVASLRRVGMPLAEVSVVLDQDARGEWEAARDVVAAHEQRLVDGLRDARSEIARTLVLLGGDAGRPAPARVRAEDLAAAIAAVRFAVAPSPPEAGRGSPEGLDLSVLTGVLVEVDRAAVRLVATDRYRMAVAQVPRRDAGDRRGAPTASVPEAAAVAPVAWIDRLARLCARTADGSVLLHVVDGLVQASPEGDEAAVVDASALPGAFPDHRAVLDRVGVGRGHRAAGLAGLLPVESDRVGLAVTPDGVAVVHDDAADVFVDPQFLREALCAAGPAPRLVLEDGLRPLAIRGDATTFSVLMPVRPSAS